MVTIRISKGDILISTIAVPADQAKGFCEEIAKAGYQVNIL